MLSSVENHDTTVKAYFLQEEVRNNTFFFTLIVHFSNNKDFFPFLTALLDFRRLLEDVLI